MLASLLLQLAVAQAALQTGTTVVDAGLPDAGVTLDDVARQAKVDDAAAPADDTDEHAEANGDEADGDEDDASEVEAMRALEDATLNTPSGSSSDLELRLLMNKLGYGSLVRENLAAAMDQAELEGAELPFQLSRVTDVESFDVSVVRDRYDIPVEMQPLVIKYIHFFQGAGRKWFIRWMNRSTRFVPVMQPILEANGLPRDLVYLAMIESGFNTQAKSWARAVGPWQFIAGTAKLFHLQEDFWVDERRDPIKATLAAGQYLRLLHQTLGHWYLAWAGYNAGGGRVRALIDRYGTRDFWELADRRGFAKETKHYVPKLIACALVAKHPEAFGFSQSEFSFEPTYEYEEVELTDSVDLEVLSLSAGVPIDTIQELNPHLKRWCTPPATEQKPFMLRLPKGKSEAFKANLAKYAPAERLHFQIHRVQKGDTLSKIAMNFHSAQEAIMRMNGLKSAKSLRLGVDLVIPVPSAAALKAGKTDTALDRQITRARRSGYVASKAEEQIPAGTLSASAAKTMTAGTVKIETVAGKTRVTYGIGRGDSLWSIARRFDVRVNDLQTWNEGLGHARGLRVGTSLFIFPGPNANLTATSGASASISKPVATKGTTHTVASGDTLSDIALKYGASVEQIKSWNGLSSSSIKRGDVLKVAAP